jgi:hypothetical protein
VDTARFVERILETENLTAELEDDEANWLLNWGINHLDEVIGNCADAEAAGNQVNALMAVMRKINQIAGSAASRDAQDLIEDLADLNDLFTAAFGPAVEPVEIRPVEKQVVLLAQMPVQAAMEVLVDRSKVAGFHHRSD